MNPILFSKNETVFTTNGLGRLQCLSCEVTEERNGMFELEATLLISSPHADEIEQLSIIGAKAHDGGDIQAFYVYKITKPINGRFTVYARHISYRLSDIPCMPFTIESGPNACAQALAGLKSHATEPCPFNFYTDKTTVAPYKQSIPASIRQRLGGIEGSVLDQFGGEYEWDNFDVHLWNKRGRVFETTGISLRYGKNITDIEQEEAIANTITGVVPYWIDTDGTNLVVLPDDQETPNHAMYSDNAGNYPYHLVQVLDLSSHFETKPTVAQLKSVAYAYVHKDGFGEPKVSIKTSFVNLWETEEYKDIAPLEHVKLCDEVQVYFEQLDINVIAKIVKTKFDVLKERYNSVEIGSIRTSLAQTVTDRNKSIDTMFIDQMTRVDTAITNKTGWLTAANGYVVARLNNDGSWKELLFMDTNDPATAKNGLRINNLGIGIWNYAVSGGNVLDGPYDTSWTINGRIGDSAGKNFWNLLTGEFSLSSTATVGGQTVQQIADASQAAAEATAAAALAAQVAIYDSDIADLQNQIDGNVTTWYYSGTPTLNNLPASQWTTTTDKDNHIGDIYYDSATGYAYRFMKDGNNYVWTKISDSDIEAALAEAQDAWDLADNKRRVFITQPVPPYDIGDLWVQGSNGDIKRCATAKTSTQTYSASDWVLASKYTDDSALASWINGTYATDKTNLQNQIDGKAETWYQASDPSSAWTTEALKNQHIGDLWYKTSDNTTWFYTKENNVYLWKQENVPTAVFDKIDGKAQIFTTTPVPPYHVGDLWFVGTNGDILTCITERTTGSYSSSDWAKKNKYTDDSAVTALDNSLTQYEVLKRLTNNFAAQGIYLSGNQLYVHAGYIVTGMLSDATQTNFWNLDTGDLRMTAGAKVRKTDPNYSGAYVPTNSNSPASDWTTDELKRANLGKTFNNTSTSPATTYIYSATEYPETSHPYSSSETAYYKFETGLTAPIKITFDSQSKTESASYDWIDLYYTLNGTTYTRRIGGNIGGMEIIIPTSDFYLYWRTDGSVTDWGWRIDSIVSASGSPEGFSASSLPSYSWTVVGGKYAWKEATLDNYVNGVAGSIVTDDMTKEEIMYALTDGLKNDGIYLENGRVYINASMINMGYMTFDRAKGGTLQLGGYNDTSGVLEIKDATGDTTVVRGDNDGIYAVAGQIGGSFLNNTEIYNVGNYLLRSKTYAMATSAGSGKVIGYFIPSELYIKEDTFKISVQWEFADSNNKRGFVAYLQCKVNGSWDYLGTVTVYNNDYSLIPTTGIKEINTSISKSDTRKWRLLIETYYTASTKVTATISAVIADIHVSSMSPEGFVGAHKGSFTGIGNFDEDTAIGNFSFDDTYFLKYEKDDYSIILNPAMLKFQNSSTEYGQLSINDPKLRIQDSSSEYIELTRTKVTCHNGSTAYVELSTYPRVQAYNSSDNYIDINADDREMRLEATSDKYVRFRGGYDLYDKRGSSSTWSIAWTSSDRRNKEEIEDLDIELSKKLIDATETKKFKYKDQDGKHYGMIAQDVREQLDNLGETDAHLEYCVNEEDEYNPRNINYQEYIPHLINYVKDLRTVVDRQQAEIDKLRSELNTLKEDLLRLNNAK